MGEEQAPQEQSWQEQVRETLDKYGDGRLLGSAEVYAWGSESDPSDFYYVLVFPDRVVCGKCKGFRFRGTCKHVKEYADWLEKGTL